MRALVHQIAALVLAGRSFCTTLPSTTTSGRPVACRKRDSATFVLALAKPCSISLRKCRANVALLTALPVAGLITTLRISSSGIP